MKPANLNKIGDSHPSQTLSLFQVEGESATAPPVVELTAEGQACTHPTKPARTLDTQCGDCACE